MRNVTFIDLSVPIQQPVEGELEGELANALAATIAYEDHRQSLPIVTRIFGCTEADLPDGQGWANEMVTLSTHAGTHMDAPWHYFPTCAGAPARRIDECSRAGRSDELDRRAPARPRWSRRRSRT